MTYAQILGGIVKNIIQLDDVNSISIFSQGFDYFIEIDGLTPRPGIGWLYNGSVFSPSAIPNDAYGNTLTFSTNGVVDSYLASSGCIYNFPAGTSHPVVYVKIAIQENLTQAQTAIQAFVDSRYSLEVRFNFTALYQISLALGYTDRATYIMQLFTWAESVVVYAASYVSAVMAMTDITQIVNTQPNFAAFLASDPLITPIAAVLITS